MILPLERSYNTFYAVGALMGDGSVLKRANRWRDYFQLRCTDRSFAQTFIRALKSLQIPNYTDVLIREGSKPLYGVYGHSRMLCNFYREAYLDEWFNIHPDTLIPFLKGFYEAEGNLVTHYLQRRFGPYYYVEINNTNLEVLSCLEKHLRTMDYAFRLKGPIKPKATVIRGIVVEFKKPVYRLILYRQKQVKSLLLRLNPCIPRKRLPSDL